MAVENFVTLDQTTGRRIFTAVAFDPAFVPSSAALLDEDRDKVAHSYFWVYDGGLAASQTDVAVGCASAFFAVDEIVMPSPGSMVKATFQIASSVTAGTVTMEPVINGTEVTATDLDLTLDSATNPDTNNNSIAVGTTGFTFSAGDTIGVNLTTDGSFAPITATLISAIWVVFDD